MAHFGFTLLQFASQLYLVILRGIYKAEMIVFLFIYQNKYFLFLVNFAYNFDYVPIAASVIYGFGFLFPLFLWFTFKCIGNPMSFIRVINYYLYFCYEIIFQLLCTYGYSLAVFIPVIFICAIPSNVDPKNIIQ